MLDRFFHPDDLDRPEVELAGTEAHHLAKVLRKPVGERVVLFDGRGKEATAEIVSVGKHSARLLIESTRLDDEATYRHVTLATAVPKGDRLRWLVQKATELGVDRLMLLETERSIVHPGVGKMDKIRQTVIAACKQSGRNRLMEIEPTASWAEFVTGDEIETPTVIAHPGGEPFDEVVSSIEATDKIRVAIGPEGGFTDAEVDLAVEHGARTARLGAHVLRVETAAVSVAAYFALRVVPKSAD